MNEAQSIIARGTCAKFLKDSYDSYMSAGFDKDQSLQLVKVLLQGVIVKQRKD